MSTKEKTLREIYSEGHGDGRHQLSRYNPYQPQGDEWEAYENGYAAGWKLTRGEEDAA